MYRVSQTGIYKYIYIPTTNLPSTLKIQNSGNEKRIAFLLCNFLSYYPKTTKTERASKQPTPDSQAKPTTIPSTLFLSSTSIFIGVCDATFFFVQHAYKKQDPVLREKTNCYHYYTIIYVYIWAYTTHTHKVYMCGYTFVVYVFNLLHPLLNIYIYILHYRMLKSTDGIKDNIHKLEMKNENRNKVFFNYLSPPPPPLLSPPSPPAINNILCIFLN